MRTHAAAFSRQYRAALLDYLLGGGESVRTRGYELGRKAVEEGVGLLQIVQAHQTAVNVILESARSVGESLGKLKASEDFLMEALAPFEMTNRGYLALLQVRSGEFP
jgi:hypothetical protein